MTGRILYNSSSVDLDSFAFTHEDMVVCFAAGNDGKESRTLGHIGAQAAAKNCITVGSCEDKRRVADAEGLKHKADGTKEGNPDNISSFSSRGPTVERRIKPDVVAPGAMILSTKSRNAETYENFGKSLNPRTSSTLARVWRPAGWLELAEEEEEPLAAACELEAVAELEACAEPEEEDCVGGPH